MPGFQRLTFGIALLITLPVGQTLFADGPVTAIGPDGQPMVVAQPGAPQSRPGQPVAPSEAGKNPKDDPSKDGKGADANKGQQPPEPKVVRRDDTTTDESDADEFKAMVGEDGRVAFEFRNQPWVDLVQWLADISDQPLDWLELPGDRVNMRSPGRYTVIETRDLFNRYLLARGYTLLEIDGGLTVAKTEKINPAIVPRAEVTQLATLPPHSYVRTLLDVGWLSAEKLSEELAPMISANGRLTALKTTNRIEAMDAAINLRQVANLLEQERDNASQEALAPEFKLRYLPAEEAKLMLEQFLGIEKTQPAPLTPQQIQMMQQMRGQNNAVPEPEKKIEVSIVANPRQNSVIIRAPIDRVAIAMEFLKRVDVAGNSIVSLSDIESRVQVFRLVSLDPAKLIEIANEMNVLEPTTRVRVDKDNNALIVSGSAADRYVISSLIERLDGSGRSFEVLPLRRLDPEEVAESIAFLMGQKDEEKNSSNSRRSYYSFGYYGGDEEEKKETDEFRVAANTRYRQVLLWANEHEMAEVQSLLVKLGELPPPGGSRQTIRMIDASATPETYEYLQRLRQQWNRLAPNPLELPDSDLFKEPNAIPPRDEDSKSADDKEVEMEDGKEVDQQPESKPPNKVVGDGNLASRRDDDPYRLTFMQQQGDQDDAPRIRSATEFDRAFRNPKAPEPQAGKSDQPPPSVRIELDSAGNLVLTSPDTDALDRLENLMLQMTPPKRPYQVFHIEHASATWMRLNLEDYFKDADDSESSSADEFYRWYWGRDDEQTDDEPSGLGTGNKLRFVDDLDTNTLVISGANSEQLRTISELIELWDVPEPVNKRKTRFTSLIQVKYGKADKIAETVKEAYRDLLSSNDKAFSKAGQGQNANGAGPEAAATKSRNGNGSGLQNSESGHDSGGTDFSFKGKLSLGIDEIGNTLLVSAEGEPLLELITAMIEQLDEAARPRGEIQVIRMPGGISGQSLREALRPIGADPIISQRGGVSVVKPPDAAE